MKQSLSSQSPDTKTGAGGDEPQHVRHNEKSHVAAADIDLIQVRNTAIASCDGNILELDIHVVLGYFRDIKRK